MTATQMSFEFDVGYDRITNFDAPGYEPKEKSTFLTKAQEELVLELSAGNAYDEKFKKCLSRLKDVIELDTFTAGEYPNGYIGIIGVSIGGATLGFTAGAGGTITDSGSGFLTAGFRPGDRITVTGTASNNGTYTIATVVAGTITVSAQDTLVLEAIAPAAALIRANPVLEVKNERADLTVGATSFYYGKFTTIEDVQVKPIDDDFYHLNKNNPFDKPSEKLLWRIDYGNNTDVKHEYITDGTYTLDTVYVHYLRKPRAIIIADANYAGDGMLDTEYFDDYTAADLDCELDPIIHRMIVDRAVKLAFAALQDEKGYQISTVEEQKK